MVVMGSSTYDSLHRFLSSSTARTDSSLKQSRPLIRQLAVDHHPRLCVTARIFDMQLPGDDTYFSLYIDPFSYQ